MDFGKFNSLFVLFNALALASTIVLVCRYLHDKQGVVIAGITAIFWLTLFHPGQYAMLLTQTHPLFILAALGALLLAEREKEFTGGVLLAVAAFIKITPALLLIYWLVTLRFKAVAGFIVGVILLTSLSLWLAGLELNLAYVGELSRVSDVLLVAWNNQSLAALVMGPEYPGEIQQWKMLVLPAWLKAAGTVLAIAAVATAGKMRKAGVAEGSAISFALLSITMFSPIAWSHYYIVLLVPLIWFIGQAYSRTVAWLPVGLILLATYESSASLLRPSFLSGGVVLVACLALWATEKPTSP